MKLYEIPRNGAFDLNHLMFVGEVVCDTSWVEPWKFHIQLAFNVDRHICFYDESEARVARAELVAAWLAHKNGSQVE